MASDYVAIEILKLIQSHPQAVLGLATGDTMINVYENLTTLLKANHVDLADV